MQLLSPRFDRLYSTIGRPSIPPERNCSARYCCRHHRALLAGEWLSSAGRAGYAGWVYTDRGESMKPIAGPFVVLRRWCDV
jgi:hypothetical protein